eukprot:CCRYP_002346-RC/>CCRYP_002346-RC protein AED:0.04 eAED:0.04 QI:400/1/1/1/1/0.85/7/1256/1761
MASESNDSSSTNSYDEDDDDDYDDEERYSLRVRLLSAVDLPPSLSPNVPLCPWFELGLVDGGEEDDDHDENHNHDGGGGGGGKRELHPKWEEEEEEEDEKDDVPKSGEGGDNRSHKKSGGNESEASKLLKKLPSSSIRTSAFKIMTKATNGGGGNGADWNEEYRWNSITNPMESILAVKLCTRLAPESPTTTTATTNPSGPANEHPSSSSSLNLPAPSSSDDSSDLVGIKGLWRKGRLQMEEHRRRTTIGSHSTAGNSREEKAAAVAQFLMKPDSEGMGQQDLVEYQQKWRERRRASDGIEGSSEVEGNRNGAAAAASALEENRSEGLCLGTLLIPLSRLPLENAFSGNGSAAVVERWYQLDGPNLVPSSASSLGDDEEDGDASPGMLHGPRRCPSVLLELTFATAQYLDGAEEEILAEANEDGSKTGLDLTSLQVDEEKENALVRGKAEEEKKIAKEEIKEDAKENGKPKPEDPELDSGIVDFVCIVGARDIGNQRNDDGSKGWVQSTPECCVLERFPPNDEFHVKNGRNTGLIPQAEWFCFPEGCKLWRGATAPSHEDLKAGGVSTSARSSDIASSFDICLGSATSFSWFVLSSNSDDYGSKLVKTYGVVVRFYVPAPKGIDPTQDDFAQTMTVGGVQAGAQKGKSSSGQKRLWVPIGICLSTTLPIVGVVEEILLRMCDAMASQISSGDSSKLLSSNGESAASSKLYDMMQKDLFHLIVNFPKPIPGVVHCSIPFLEGERLHITTAPPNGLPSLPHGGAIASTCRLLGAEGLTLLLAAALTECKILIHSVDVANVAMVAEVISALIFPFTWQLPFIPVLPKDMLEFLEAPLSFFVGIPTICLQYCDRNVLSEIVVVDLDNIASSTDYDGRRGPRTKIPTALPASVSTSISKAVFRLLREEDEIDAQMNAATFPGCRRSARLENESMAERKFRIHVAIQICSLIRGYQECLFFVSASQPVFNRDRFLRQAPALFEDKRPSVLIDNNYSDRTQKILSPRSKRFLSVLVNSQHFHQLLERLSSEETAFFHEVMESIEQEDDAGTGAKSYFSTNFGSSACDEVADKLYDSLERIEQKIPTYRVDRKPRPPGIIRWEEEEDEEFKIDYNFGSGDTYWFEDEEKTPSISFTFSILKPIMTDQDDFSTSSAGVHALSLEYLVELEKNPWRYNNMLQIPIRAHDDKGETKSDEKEVEFIEIRKKTKLRDAIGERRFRAWKIANDHKEDDDIQNTPLIEKSSIDKTFDLSTILSNVPDLPFDGSVTSTQPHVDAKDRDKVRRCLEIAFGSSQNSSSFQENGRDLIADAEAALRNPSAQRYLFSVLSQRNKIEKQRSKRNLDDSKQRAATQQSVSRLELSAFECIVRLCIAVLEACQEEEDYESAYRLLSLTGGFCTITANPGNQADHKTTYMTERINSHSIFADLRLWERVLLLHQKEQQNDRKDDVSESAGDIEQLPTDAADADETADSDSYDAAVSTLYEMVGYGVPAEELARFATRISEEKGWFTTDKGQSLLVLARRLTAKRDEDGEKTGEAGDFNLGKGNVPNVWDRRNSRDMTAEMAELYAEESLVSEDISWAHPSISLFSSERHTGARAFLGTILGGATESQPISGTSHHGNEIKQSSSGDIFNVGGYSGRVAITAMAAFGSTAVVTGGVDGSVFLAHTIHFGADNNEFESNCSSKQSCTSLLHSKSSLINGVKLQWGSQGESDNECVIGAVSCLAASKGSGYRVGGGVDRLSLWVVRTKMKSSHVWTVVGSLLVQRVGG